MRSPSGVPPPGCGCPLREAGTHTDVSRRPRGPFPSRVWAVFPGRTADPHASSEPWNPRPPCVCVCPGLLAETLTFWVSAGPPAPPVGATWLLGKEPRCPGRQLALPPECPHCCGSCSLTVVALAAGVLGCPELLGVGNARLSSPRCPLLSEAQQIRPPPLSQGAFQMLRKHHIDLVFLCVHAECNFNFLSGKKVTSLHVFATQMAWALQ